MADRLTPIRVRGKNKRDQSMKAKQLRATSSSFTNPSKRTRGHPLKLEASPSSKTSSHVRSSNGNKSKKSATAQRQSKKRKKHISALEALPAELLQTIFILSSNVNLPLASPRLALALSSDHVRMHLCLAAFTGVKHAMPFKHLIGLPDITPHPSIQSAILRQPWLTFSLLERCKEKRFEVLKTDREERDSRFNGTRLEKIRAERRTESLISDSAHWPTFQNVQMPERLLRGPWSSDKVNLLRDLVGRGLQIDWVYSSAGEVARASLLEATMSGNIDIISLLTEQLGTLPTTEIVRQAVLGLSKEQPDDYDDGGVRCTVLEMLVESVVRTEEMDWDDAEITAWAVRASESGDWRGRWVLRMMRSKGDPKMTTPDPYFLMKSP
ncbi:MAG: hypothetical protein M1835_003957 [Candelina submexicana]|nr:MAG: hypothetical protein M1835_003957 [Candelina submexicana]